MAEQQIEHTDQLRCPVESLTLNELCFDSDIFYDQPCFFACRMDCHGTYCHNAEHDDKPMKCRLMPHEQGECDGFKKNEPLIERCAKPKGA